MLHTIVLGPEMDLHPGIHESLARTPPAGYRYVIRAAEHVFAHARRSRRPFSPLAHRHWGELVDFGPGRGLVHSSRWPVLGRRSWVVELDDFGYPAYAGRHALAPSFRGAFRRRWSAAFTRDVVRRVEVMLAAYTHPSCQAILFRTREAVEGACRGLVGLGLEAWIEGLLAKCAVVYPAASPVPRTVLRAKWADLRRPRVVFCGRDFSAKDGAVALRVVRRLLADGHDFDFVYVGAVPSEERRAFRDVLARVRVFESLPRSAVLDLLARSHVLFHPSPRESVGMVFIEAAAAGLAVVASRGPGLPHLAELLPARGVRAVDRTRDDQGGAERRFERSLGALLRRPDEARRMGLANYAQALEGPISIRRRNDALAGIYEAGVRAPPRAPLGVDALLAGTGWASTRMTSARLARLIDDYRRARGLRELAVFV